MCVLLTREAYLIRSYTFSPKIQVIRDGVRSSSCTASSFPTPPPLTYGQILPDFTSHYHGSVQVDWSERIKNMSPLSRANLGRKGLCWHFITGYYYHR